MSLYGSFTLKEWLALHCVTKDIDDLFRKALKDNDEPMAVLALAKLIIKDGFILNSEEIPNVLSILDAAGIENPLPAFSDEVLHGKGLALFTLNKPLKRFRK